MYFYLIAIFMILHFNFKEGYSQLIRHYMGCYETFDGYNLQKDISSVTLCIEECKVRSDSNTFAALKNGNECYCGNNFKNVSEGINCRKWCNGPREYCGGDQHYSVYSICPIGTHGRDCDIPCSRCQSTVPCKRNGGECFPTNCRKDLHVYCDIARFLNNVNVAFNRPAYQSSTYHDNRGRTYPASLAVDGNNNTNFDVGQSCGQTFENENPWFYVDLQVETIITKVVITIRYDQYAARLEDLEILLSNDTPDVSEISNVKNKCYDARKDSLRIELTCSSNSKHRYLIVTTRKKAFLSICEIEAYVGDCKNYQVCGYNEECDSTTIISDIYYSRCICKSGFLFDNSACIDIDECRGTNFCNKSVSQCANTNGSYTCKCKAGYENDDDGIRCIDVNECRNVASCNSTISTCRNNIGSYTCECKSGYRSQKPTTCIDNDECSYNSHSCDHQTTICRNTEGSYYCECKNGYEQYDGRKCKDVDECGNKSLCNSTISTCRNNIGSYICECKPGYQNQNPTTCIDYDECRFNNHLCDRQSTICRNNIGSYYCECKDGYQQDRNNPLKCTDVDECKNGSSCNTAISTCINNVGSYTCACKDGYRSRYHNTCEDVDECSQNKCDASSTKCENTAGSFKCNCLPGFKPWNVISCSDIDECAINKHNCDLSTTRCENSKGSYRCDCKDGFEKISNNNTSCKDVDECSRNFCDKTSTICHNVLGSYSCHCKDGFKRSDYNKCSDVDECSLNNDCAQQTTTCQNIYGGYKCVCNSGYEYASETNRSCRDINECERITFNKTSTKCINEDGSYVLQCQEGFQNQSKLCEDIDECKTEKYDSTVNCTNLFGSVNFTCEDGFYLHKENDILKCTAHSNVAKVVAGLFVMLVLIIFGGLIVFLWKRKRNRIHEKKVPSKACEMNNTTRPATQIEVVYSNVDPKQSTTRIKTEDLGDHIRVVSDKDSSGFENEFKAIPKAMEMSTSYAQQQELKSLNRFQNIFPYDQTRVILSNTGETFSDYINASHIHGFENTVPLIAAQGPTEQTVNDFWRMITEQRVNVIVMLTQLVENNKDKCFLYWPDSEGERKDFGNISVSNSSVIVWEKFLRRDLKVVRKEDNSTFVVTQWQYLAWPDHGVPTDVQSFLRFRNNVRASMDKSGKTLVHCSAGVGRTGCFIAIDVLLEEAAARGSVDIVACVTELRRQRPMMVQTAVQYDFIYFALKLAFEEENVYIPIPNFHKKYLEMYKTNKNGKSKIVDQFENLIKATSEAIKNSATSKELTNQSDKWKVYLSDSTNSSNKYVFASFPSETDVEKFWEICMEHANVIVLLDNIRDFKLPFLPNNIKSLVCKGFTLDFASTLPMGILSVDTVTASSQNDLIYENRTDLKNQTRHFRVIRVCVNSKDFLTKELFQAIKAQADLVPAGLNTQEGFTHSKFAVSRDGMKLASFYVACCKLFEQMESHKEVSVYNTVLDLHKGARGPIFTLAQYKKLYEIIDKEVIGRKPFQLL